MSDIDSKLFQAAVSTGPCGVLIGKFCEKLGHIDWATLSYQLTCFLVATQIVEWAVRKVRRFFKERRELKLDKKINAKPEPHKD